MCPDVDPAPARTGRADRPRREVVSFVRRGTRLSHSRQAAWDRSHGRWVLDLPRGERDTLPDVDGPLDLRGVFGRSAELVVEVGSGLGENIAAAAAAHPERDHLAFEVYLPGLAQTLERLEREGAGQNVRLLPFDALHAVGTLLPPASVHELWVFFPDPWHKARHRKRRLVAPPFLDVVAPLLAPGGVLRTATDWAHYALTMREALDADPRFENLHPDGPRPAGEASDPIPEELPRHGWAPRFDGRVLTSFERKAGDAGRLVWELAHRRADPSASPNPSPGPTERTTPS